MNSQRHHQLAGQINASSQSGQLQGGLSNWSAQTNAMAQQNQFFGMQRDAFVERLEGPSMAWHRGWFAAAWAWLKGVS